MHRGVAHEGRSGDQLIFHINMSFLHILDHMFAAHLLENTRCISIWPPEEDNRATVKVVLLFFYIYVDIR